MSRRGRVNRLLAPMLDDRPMILGLVNNMADHAQDACERRFRAMFGHRCAGRPIRWRLFDATRAGRRATRPSAYGGIYEPVDRLFDAPLDAVVVTGAEPLGKALRDEPCWSVVARVAEWAERTRVGVLWSCLASHAAVAYLDGIERHRLETKRSGVFSCRITDPSHPLTTGAGAVWSIPHSRCHTLDVQDLQLAGYEILTMCDRDEVDAFCKHETASLLFCQGHPEYERATLWREYKRDTLRFLAGELAAEPELPRHYLSDAHAAAVRSLIAADVDLAELRLRFHTIEASPGFLLHADDWQGSGRALCSNWLSSLCATPTHRGVQRSGARSALHDQRAGASK